MLGDIGELEKVPQEDIHPEMWRVGIHMAKGRVALGKRF